MTEAERERAAVVAYVEQLALGMLREFCRDPDEYEEGGIIATTATLAQMAEDIRNGEHLTSEGK